MSDFIETYKVSIYGILHGFDRIIIKGHIPNFYHRANFYYFFNKEGVIMMLFRFANKIKPFGFSPFSINLTQAPGFGLSIISKARIYNFVLEGKIIPVNYIKDSEIKMLDNNSFLGLHYWLTKRFSLGARYNRYDKYKNLSFMFAWRLVKPSKD